MRKIKFRVWNKHDKVLFYPQGLWWYDGGPHTLRFKDCDKGLPKVTGFTGASFFELMEFTGLKDKNKKDIYEGDILKWRQGVGWIIMPVVADEYATGFFPFSRTTQIPTPDSREVEIIGNIYENPELVK
jgi:uncharacterized phage protein (TIGR01671 family)